MPLVDTSAWIEFLRDPVSPIGDRVAELMNDDIAAVCEAVQMEVFAGARNDQHLVHLRGVLSGATIIPIQPSDYYDAAILYRACRQNGITIRSQIDCLIAAVAIRAQIPILHNDSDFTALAQHTDLTIDPASL